MKYLRFWILALLALTSTSAMASANEYVSFGSLKVMYSVTDSDKELGYDFDLLIQDGIDRDTAIDTVLMLPEHTLKSAVIIAISAVAQDTTEYQVYAAWDIGDIIYDELWLLSTNKSVSEPFMTMYTEDEDNMDIYSGYDELYIRVVDGEPEMVQEDKRTFMEVACDAWGFMNTYICPWASIIWPQYAPVCLGTQMLEAALCN